MTDIASQINACKNLYVVDISEPEDNALRVVLEEGSTAEDVAADGPVTHVREIKHREGDRTFTLLWDSYIAYSVRNESFATLDREEQCEGSTFVVYSKSRYLDFVAKATIASQDYPGPFKHWGVFGLNHILDIVSTDEPVISVKSAA